MPPISLHPHNPRYFHFRDRPTVLITSAEHYGAVLNQAFDYIAYLDELQARGFNLTRIFTGAYVEDPTSFGIENNTLAPAPGQFLCPWARAADGAKFDLERWDAAYFARLRDFLRQADRRGVVVELVLFCPFYEEGQWALSPMNARNNLQQIGAVPRDEVLTLNHPALLAVQEAMVHQVVAETGEFENLYYEICNEPYFGGVTMEWQHRIVDAIVRAEARQPARHLIAQNIANGSRPIVDPHPAVSLFNFHYANPPDAVAENAALHKPIGFDESGFRGTADLPYRGEAWEFMLAGGAVYNHLDYSFTVQHPDGTATFTRSPGGGGPALRGQLAILKRFIESFDFPRMRPEPGVITSGVPTDATARALVEPGRAYAIYLNGGTRADLALALPKGRYHAEWLNPRTGEVDRQEEFEHHGGEVTLASPPYKEDIALRVIGR